MKSKPLLEADSLQNCRAYLKKAGLLLEIKAYCNEPVKVASAYNYTRLAGLLKILRRAVEIGWSPRLGGASRCYCG